MRKTKSARAASERANVSVFTPPYYQLATAGGGGRTPNRPGPTHLQPPASSEIETRLGRWASSPGWIIGHNPRRTCNWIRATPAGWVGCSRAGTGCPRAAETCCSTGTDTISSIGQLSRRCPMTCAARADSIGHDRRCRKLDAHPSPLRGIRITSRALRLRGPRAMRLSDRAK